MAASLQYTLPGPVAPMLATLGRPLGGPGRAIEFKWDGIRCTAYTGGSEIRLLSRSGHDITTAYPEVVESLASACGGRRVALDGEIVALDALGNSRPLFSRLQQRMQLPRPSPDLLTRLPVSYYVFDLLVLDEFPTLRLPYRRRRELLAELGLVGEHVRVPPHLPGSDPQEAIVAAKEQGVEGIMIKRMGSIYQPACRSRDWIKVPFNHTQEIVIIGYKPGQGRRAATVGSLLLAVAAPDGRVLFAGSVGTGFTDRRLLDRLRDLLAPLTRATAPVDGVPREFARGARWVEPVLVGEVFYRGWTDDNRLRHPVWRGLRPDKSPDEAYVSGPAETVELRTASHDGAWLVEVVRIGPVTFCRVTHGGEVFDRLPGIDQVQAILEREQINLADLEVVPAGFRGENDDWPHLGHQPP